MDRARRDAVRFLQIPLADAVCIATLTPADILGLRNKGRIEPGADADLTRVTEEGTVKETIVDGELAYQRQEN